MIGNALRSICLVAAALVCALPAVGSAQKVSGLYIGAGAGGNLMMDERTSTTYAFGSYTSTNSFLGKTTTQTFPPSAITLGSRASYDGGAVGVGSVGYGFGNGLRVELEGYFRYNGQTNGFADQKKGGVLVNALYDFDLGLSWLYPYGGAGVGYEWVDRGFDTGRTNSFAYQGIVGVAVPIALVPGLSATFEYRFLGLAGARASDTRVEAGYGNGYFSNSAETVSITQKYSNNFNHSLLLGVRYAFNHQPPARAITPEVPPAPLAQASRSYVVFFDWDRADLSDRARQIVAEAAQASTRVAATRIEVQGNADASGARLYNQALSLRRARVVAAELVRDGVPATGIAIQAFGDTRPLVPTAPGVREPQNRRVAIILR